jgi:hypothetical protein
VLAQGDVVAQLTKATGESGILHSLLNGARKYDCVSKKKSQGGRRPCLGKKKEKKEKQLFVI